MKVRVVLMTENEEPVPVGDDRKQLEARAETAWATVVKLLSCLLPEDEAVSVERVEVLEGEAL